MPALSVPQIDVIAPNLKRRLSGVTATVVRLVPIQSQMIGIVTTGQGLPANLPRMPFWQLAFLPRDRWRVWHARRNTEMVLGLILRHVFRRRLKLLFTSASQRRHTAFTRWLIGRMDRVVATSERSAAYLQRDATIVMHGIDTRTFAPPADRAALRQRLGLPLDAVLVGCYGRIRPSKGTDIFVHSMMRLASERSGVTALVMGRATSKFTTFHDGLVKEVQDAGLSDRILFLPEVPVNAMADWYGALDLFVAPQRWEGFGLTPLEAMACGVPLVATRVGAFESLVAPGAGRLVPANDQEALTLALSQALSEPATLAQAGTAGRAHVLANHRIEHEASALVAIYREMLA